MKSESKHIFERVLKDQRFRQEVVRKSLEFFFPIYLHEYIKHETPPFHNEIFRILQNEKIKLAVIAAFRGSAKSTIVTTAYVLWSILGVQQKKFIIVCSQTEAKARQHLNNIKYQLLNNELLKKDLGPFEEERNNLGNATALVLGIKQEIQVNDIDIRNYAKFILKDGSIEEKRELLTCFKSKIVLKEKCIYLN